MTAWPIDWRALVAEAVRRRKEEGLTQRTLAALAGVSPPTVNAFERGEINLRFERIVAILEALGLFSHPAGGDDFASFIESARARWGELADTLPEGVPARQSHGHSELAYSFAVAEHADYNPSSLRSRLAHAPRTSNWPPFWVPLKPAIKPVIRGNLVECWLGKLAADHGYGDAAHSDFWQVSRYGHAYLQRGYQEDGADFDPGTIFDLTLPVLRAAEVLRHAAWLAREFEEVDSKIRFAGRYTGLAGRELLPWSKPTLREAVRGRHRARADSVAMEVTFSLSTIEQSLPEAVHDALLGLYERFDGYVLPMDIVRNVLQQSFEAN